ncbi:putative methyltransferase-like protein 24 [Tubulanus polymorphus]|uniref:putative methyltransferase-like protein 24 n=1 Tax=Tubulanus polymorphus TaxID=672921 RepID=UPI003DA4F8E9
MSASGEAITDKEASATLKEKNDQLSILGLTGTMRRFRLPYLLIAVVLVFGGCFILFRRGEDNPLWLKKFSMPKAIREMKKFEYPNSYSELFHLYHSKILRQNFYCKRMRRFGNVGDGGWEMCLDEPHALKRGNCLVYSFGIAYDYSFDDSVAEELNCEIHSFDPSINQVDYKRGKYISFHDLGVGGTNGMNTMGWKLLTVASIMKALGHENMIIDYLKIDVESSEWETFEQMIKAGTFSHVRQLGVEYHLNNSDVSNEEYVKKHMNELRQHLTIFDNLELDGFKIFHFHTNMQAPTYLSSLTGKAERCCQEIYYVNTRIIS